MTQISADVDAHDEQAYAMAVHRELGHEFLKTLSSICANLRHLRIDAPLLTLLQRRKTCPPITRASR